MENSKEKKTPHNLGHNNINLNLFMCFPVKVMSTPEGMRLKI